MINRRLLWVRVTLSLLLSITLLACDGGKMDELKAYVKKIKARPPIPLKPLPEIKPIETFVYEPKNRRDPFIPDAQSQPEERQVVVNTGPVPDPNRRKEELEGFELDSLRMVGTLQKDNILYGLIRTKTGILYRVQTGNYMGLNNGQVTGITEDSIHLNEVVSDGAGHWTDRAATLALTKQK